MPEVLPNLIGLAGYKCSTVPDLVRAILDVYAACATVEGTAAPLIQFGRRYVEQINAPSGRILIVPQRGALGGVREMGSGKVASVSPSIKVYLWGAEPTQTAFEVVDELARFDLADPMVARFVNVVNRVAVGRVEWGELDPDAGESDPARVNEYGETYSLTFRFLQDIARDGVVFGILPTLGSDGKPTPRLAPPPNYASAGAALNDLDLTTEPAE